MSELEQQLGIERQEVRLMSLQHRAAAILKDSEGTLGHIWDASWPMLQHDTYNMLDPVPFRTLLTCPPSKQPPEFVMGIDFRNHAGGRDTLKHGHLHMGVAVVKCQLDPHSNELLEQTPLCEWLTPAEVTQVVLAVGMIAANAEVLPNLSDDLTQINDPRFGPHLL